MKLNKETYKEYKKYPEKVLQFGEGNFLRAFVDWQIDKMNKEVDFNGSVVVVQPIEHGLVHMLNDQDGLYTLYLQGIKDRKPVKEHLVIKKLVFSLAALIEFYKGKRGDEDINLSDDKDILNLFKSAWGNYDGAQGSLRALVIKILGYEKNWKRDLNEVEGLTDAVTEYLMKIEKLGIKEALKDVM
jgi:mannitol-1-phosphate/altronate dehydrogenase